MFGFLLEKLKKAWSGSVAKFNELKTDGGMMEDDPDMALAACGWYRMPWHVLLQE